MNVFERFAVGLKAGYWAWFVEGAAERLAPTVRHLGMPALEVRDERLEGSGRGGEGGRGRLTEAKPVAGPTSRRSSLDSRLSTLDSSRSEALTLLETLQREARLIDFLKEEIGAYQDAQIGAAVRDIHRDAGKALERLFALRPVLDQAEGSPVTLDASTAGRVRLVGNVREGATEGTLAHHGWAATKTELPLWSGPKEAERVVAPAEVEVS